MNNPDFNELEIPLTNLAHKSVDAISKSSDPLKTLRDISQNLPTLAHALQFRNANVTELETRVQELQNLGYWPQINIIWVNGIPIDATTMDPFEYFYFFYFYPI